MCRHDDSIREKIKVSVPKATSDHSPDSNPNTDSIPSNGESTDQVDYCHMPSDVLRDLSVICSKTDISNTEKWSMYCKMMQSCEHLTENQKKQHAEESKWTGNSTAKTSAETSSKSKTKSKVRCPNLVAAGYIPYKDNPVIQAYKDNLKDQSVDDDDDEVEIVESNHSDSPEMFSFLCSVQCKNPNSGNGRRLAVITRLKKRLNSLLVAKALSTSMYSSLKRGMWMKIPLNHAQRI